MGTSSSSSARPGDGLHPKCQSWRSPCDVLSREGKPPGGVEARCFDTRLWQHRGLTSVVCSGGWQEHTVRGPNGQKVQLVEICYLQDTYGTPLKVDTGDLLSLHVGTGQAELNIYTLHYCRFVVLSMCRCQVGAKPILSPRKEASPRAPSVSPRAPGGNPHLKAGGGRGGNIALQLGPSFFVQNM